jgi:peptidyl-prolyl cis-trans isomerase D
MLSTFRRLVESKFGKVIVFVILGVIALAFLLSDLSGGMGGAGGPNPTIAKVGGTKIGGNEVTTAVERDIAAARQQVPGLNAAAYASAGGVERTLDGLIGARALERFAAEQGLVASKRLIDGEIASIPAFNGPSGAFDQSTFKAVLQQQRITEAEVRTDIGGQILRRLLLVPAAGGARAPLGVVSHYAALLMETRHGAVGFVPLSAVPAPAAPDEAAVQAYYKRNIARFTLGERRVIRYAAFGPATITVPPPSEADVQKAYAANAATYAGRATRTLSQVVFPEQAAASAFAARVKAGTTFVEAAAAAGFTDPSLGEQTEAQFAGLANAAAARAVFALPQGGVSAPLQSELGWHVVRVDAIQASAAKPLAAVRGEIVARLTKERRDAALADQVAQIEDAIEGGASFEDVAKERKLAIVTTPPLLANGAAPGVAGWKVSPTLAPLLRHAFEASADEDPVVEAIGTAGDHALVGVTRVDPPRPLPIGEVRAQIVAAIRGEAASRAARAIADAIAAKAARGVPLATAFAQAGVSLPAPEPVNARRIDISRRDARVPPALGALFSIPVGKTRVIPADGQGWFVVKLERTVTGDPTKTPGLMQATRQQFAPVIANEFAEQFARAAQADVGVTRDEAALRALKAQLAGNAAPAQ